MKNQSIIICNCGFCCSGGISSGKVRQWHQPTVASSNPRVQCNVQSFPLEKTGFERKAKPTTFAKGGEITKHLIDGVKAGVLEPYDNDSVATKITLEEFTRRLTKKFEGGGLSKKKSKPVLVTKVQLLPPEKMTAGVEVVKQNLLQKKPHKPVLLLPLQLKGMNFSQATFI